MSNNEINFKFEIKLNDDGRPYVHICDENEDHSEVIFMAFELTRYALYDILQKNEEKNHLESNSVIKISECGDILTQISNEYANLLKGQMDALNDINNIIQNKDNNTGDE